MNPHAICKYTGTTPGADANTYVLLATTQATGNAGWPECYFALAGVKKVTLVIKHNNAGTLKVYESTDRGTNWRQIDSITVAAPAATAATPYDFVVEGMRDWKLEWVNGGAAQSPWDVLLSLSEQRAHVA
jgi:hypothetical protein